MSGPSDEAEAGTLPSSGLGLASLALFVIACLFEYAFVDNALTEHTIRKANEARGLNVGDVAHGVVEMLNCLTGGFANLIGAILGFAGLFQRQRRRTLAVWGLVSNVMLPLLNILFLIVLG